MKIAVFGATGMIGSEIVAEAVSRGHEVSAFSRSGGEVAGVDVHAVDLADATAFAEIAAANDVVVTATGPSRTGEPHESYLTSVSNALANAGDTRLLMVGGAGSLEVNGQRLVDSPEFPEDYKPEARTVAKAYDMLRNDAPADLNWTMISPAPVIEPGLRTGDYKVGEHSPAGESISTQDFAVAVLDEIEIPAHERARFTVAN